jgi:hypothetical protein
MKALWKLAALLVLALPVSAMGADKKALIVAEGDKLPTVKVGDTLRISRSGPSGKTEITAKVEGPAKVVSTTEVREYVNGQPKIGAFTKEFVIKANSAGTAKVIVSIKDTISGETTTKEMELKIE